VTGHTGFKGGWLSLWLQALGSDVSGLSLGVPTTPSIYELARVGGGMSAEADADIRRPEAVDEAVERLDPEIVIHMAAQSLVRLSFEQTRETFDTNVMGTVNVLDAVRRAPNVRVVVNVTSDKCYENRGWEWGYREDEPMGGHDPYSSSKGAAELVTSAYRRSFFSDVEGTRLASARAGNVIGGGDWGAERLVSDMARAVIADETLHIRSPTSVRPWQHVLNPLSGYLLLAQSLWKSPELAGGWNFGPPDGDGVSVADIVEGMRARWSQKPRWEHDSGPHPPEAHQLKLDSSRARLRLGWRPLVSLSSALDSIVDWYDAYMAGADMRILTLDQIERLTAPSDLAQDSV
jgi:CDP-glucose 4,6-dehydratase